MYDESIFVDPQAGGWWQVGKLTEHSSFQELYTGANGCALGVAQFVRDRGCVQFREIDGILAQAGIPINDGDEELTGEHIHRDKIVHESTTLRGPVSGAYCDVIEQLFTTYPVDLMIGDPASFPSGHEPWHVVWRREHIPADVDVTSSAPKCFGNDATPDHVRTFRHRMNMCENINAIANRTKP